MKWRNVVALILAAAVWPSVLYGQAPNQFRRIGVLMGLPENDPQGKRYLSAFTVGLRDLGWVEGSNLRIDYRAGGGDMDRARTLAQELVALKPDLIVPHTDAAVRAFLEQGRNLPMVFVSTADPVTAGYVASYAHPGGIITGFTCCAEFSLSGKWLELLKEVVPNVHRVAFMFNPDTAPEHGSPFLRDFKDAASKFAVEATAAPVRSAAEIESVMAALENNHVDGLIVMQDIFMSAQRDVVIAAANRQRLPAIYPFRYFATSGGLISYGIDGVDNWRKAAVYVDRIFKGTNPGDLPVQSPTKFELVINLKTAKAFGLTIPQSLLATADDVIQ
jgi:putative tryptophan/tyrosine transport system substrate-binding protein